MKSLAEKIITCIKFIIGKMNVKEPIISKLPDTLVYTVLHSQVEFNQSLAMFMNYVHIYDNDQTKHIDYITLRMYIMILNGPQGKYQIGNKVIHKNKVAYIVDYIYYLDLYEIQYEDASVFGETHGWFRDTDFRNTNESEYNLILKYF